MREISRGEIAEVTPALEQFAEDLQQALGYLRAAEVVQAEHERQRLLRAALGKVRHLQAVLPALPLPDLEGGA